jgi:hypothetical protein
MRIHLVTVATAAMVALVSGCAVERTQTVASTASPCRDPRLMQICRQVDASGDPVAGEEGEGTSGTKGKLASKSEIERRGAMALLRDHHLTPPPSPGLPQPHPPEPKSPRPPPPPPRH